MAEGYTRLFTTSTTTIYISANLLGQWVTGLESYLVILADKPIQ